jgi:hypothetical protein
MKEQVLPPRASSLSESMRDIGYSLETAVADIIDNSITAGASRIDLWFDFRAEEPFFGIVDNGHGMDEEELIDAMRHGAIHPRDVRSEDDLGRFGLGMKTASLSQCRKLTVISKKNNRLSGAIWDLDVLLERNEWVINTLEQDEIDNIPCTDKIAKEGTLVLWEKLDRLFDGKLEAVNHEVCLEKIEIAEKHLELVFHRFLAGEVNSKRLQISVSGHQIKPFDPFCLTNKATQLLPKETIRMGEHTTTIKPYILPHHNKLSRKEDDYYKDRSEFLKNQGFYIYRNNRLTAWGSWFGLRRQEEATKLVRVQVDFPNALDEYWTIDIKKSKVSMPYRVKQRLQRIISKITKQSIRTHTGKGHRLSEDGDRCVWTRCATPNGIRYKLNREHLLLKAFRGSLDKERQKRFMGVLEVVEQSIPVEVIYSDYSANPRDFEGNREIDSEEIKKKLRLFFDILSENGKINEQQFREAVCLKPFCDYPAEEIENVIREKFDV